MSLPLGDGSWDLQLLVTDLQVERVLRVTGDDHIGGVMIKLVDMLDIAMDWSDHAVWAPSRNMWLTNTRYKENYKEGDTSSRLDLYVCIEPVFSFLLLSCYLLNFELCMLCILL